MLDNAKGYCEDIPGLPIISRDTVYNALKLDNLYQQNNLVGLQGIAIGGILGTATGFALDKKNPYLAAFTGLAGSCIGAYISAINTDSHHPIDVVKSNPVMGALGIAVTATTLAALGYSMYQNLQKERKETKLEHKAQELNNIIVEVATPAQQQELQSSHQQFKAELADGKMEIKTIATVTQQYNAVMQELKEKDLERITQASDKLIGETIVCAEKHQEHEQGKTPTKFAEKIEQSRANQEHGKDRIH